MDLNNVDDCGLIASLGDWFWESVFRRLAPSERACAELVCQRWYGVLRTWQFWEKLLLCHDGSLDGKWDNAVVGKLVSNSFGPKFGMGLSPPDWWPRPSPIREIDLTGCSFRGVSPLRLLDTLPTCPRLELLKMSGMKSSLTGAELPFHSRDFVYMQEMVSQFGEKLTNLEIDVHVESTWSSVTLSKTLDPVSWAQLLDWLSCPNSPFKIKNLEILEIPNTVWEEVGDIGEVLIERPDASKENLRELACALGLSSSVQSVTFGPHCQLGDEGAELFVDMIKGNRCISRLSMQGNGMSTEGAKNVVGLISRSGPPLVMLDVSGNDVDPGSAALMQEALKKNNGSRDVELLF
ncbi:hypothetical protein BSKO_10188 [Bryopsis sp. KO-2023]|nr:hypothetical protein BSKO_10188 [Bryopsis sp. KO-2023]